MKTIHHFTAALAVTLAAGAVFTARAQTPPSPGISISGASFSGSANAREATPADIGLPVYPGAVPQRDRPNQGNGANVALQWAGNGSAFDFRVAAMKFSSSDSMADVAAYYRNELSRHGTVLDCSGPASSRHEAEATDKQTLRCGKDGGKPGELLYKVGTQQQFRMVALQPVASGGVRFQLVRLVLPE